MFRKLSAAIGVVLLSALALGLGAVYFTWISAPMVGGEFWPYIRVLASFIVGVIVFKVSLFLLWFVAVSMGFVTASMMWEKGTEEDPWEASDINKLDEMLNEDN